VDTSNEIKLPEGLLTAKEHERAEALAKMLFNGRCENDFWEDAKRVARAYLDLRGREREVREINRYVAELRGKASGEGILCACGEEAIGVTVTRVPWCEKHEVVQSGGDLRDLANAVIADAGKGFSRGGTVPPAWQKPVKLARRVLAMLDDARQSFRDPECRCAEAGCSHAGDAGPVACEHCGCTTPFDENHSSAAASIAEHEATVQAYCPDCAAVESGTCVNHK
jgi:hypothetical protein